MDDKKSHSEKTSNVVQSCQETAEKQTHYPGNGTSINGTKKIIAGKSLRKSIKKKQRLTQEQCQIRKELRKYRDITERE